jgi:hypothetical protein
MDLSQGVRLDRRSGRAVNTRVTDNLMVYRSTYNSSSGKCVVMYQNHWHVSLFWTWSVVCYSDYESNDYLAVVWNIRRSNNRPGTLKNWQSGTEGSRRISNCRSYCSARPGGSFPLRFNLSSSSSPFLIIRAAESGRTEYSGKYENAAIATFGISSETILEFPQNKTTRYTWFFLAYVRIFHCSIDIRRVKQDKGSFSRLHWVGLPRHENCAMFPNILSYSRQLNLDIDSNLCQHISSAYSRQFQELGTLDSPNEL